MNVTPEQIAAVKAVQRAESDALTYEPTFHLLSNLANVAQWIVEDSAFERGRTSGARRPYADADLTGLRTRVERLVMAFAAYDQCIAEGKARVSNSDWERLCKGDAR